MIANTYRYNLFCRSILKNLIYEPARSISAKYAKSELEKTKPSPKEILEREFPDAFNRNGEFVSHMGYVQFIDDALARMKELGLHKDKEMYKQLLRIFPSKSMYPEDKHFIFKKHKFPQQLAVGRVLHMMSMNLVPIDRDFEVIITDVFCISSEIWNKVARMNYWQMKLRNLDNYPLPEVLPEEPHKLAKLGLQRMLDDEQTVVVTRNTSNLQNSIDKTWVVYAQCPTQQALIDRLDDKAILYVEDGGTVWVGSNPLTYYVLKYYVDSEVAKEKARVVEPHYNFEEMKMGFYGRPIKDKLDERYEKHYADGSYILGIGLTGTSSQDSLSSWLKLLQQRNPKLNKLSVLFRLENPNSKEVATPEPPGPQSNDTYQHKEEQASN